jgi:hypothetical protein
LLPEVVNDKKDGGLWNRPFAGGNGSWCVKGDLVEGALFECGDQIDPEDGAKYET